MNKEYEQFVSSIEKTVYYPSDVVEEVAKRIRKIAEKYGFNELLQDSNDIFFESKRGDILIAREFDHELELSIEQTGFDIYLDLSWILGLFEEKMISEDAYHILFRKLCFLSKIPYNLRKTVEQYLNDPKSITKEQYQAIYENFCIEPAKELREKAERYAQKADLSQFFQDINFQKRLP